MPSHKTVKFQAGAYEFRVHPNEAIEIGITALSAVYPALGKILRAARDGNLHSAIHHHAEGIDHEFLITPTQMAGFNFVEALMRHDPDQFELELPGEYVETSQFTLSMFSPIDLSQAAQKTLASA